MSTRHSESDAETLQRAKELQAESDLDAGAVADATIQTLIHMNIILSPIIGEVGCNVLFKRSLHLSSRTFPWLAIAENYGDTDDLFASINVRLANHHTNEVIEASSALLEGFTELLATLIGDSLVETLLGSLNEAQTPASKQKKTSKQDKSS